jgi:hypothetical protein
MAKRFGRNQKRRLAERIAYLERVSVRTRLALSRVYERLDRAIEIDIKLLKDDTRLHYEARMSAHHQGYESLHVALRIDARELEMQREKDRFVEYMSKRMAHQLMAGIGIKWNA